MITTACTKFTKRRTAAFAVQEGLQIYVFISSFVSHRTVLEEMDILRLYHDDSVISSMLRCWTCRSLAQIREMFTGPV